MIKIMSCPAPTSFLLSSIGQIGRLATRRCGSPPTSRIDHVVHFFATASLGIPPPPLCLGYVAGLHASSPGNPWSGHFDEAYDVLQEVDPQVLLDFEREMLESEGFVFRHSTKSVSVIDRVAPKGEAAGKDGGGNTRFLVFNDRPKLVQSAIVINAEGEELAVAGGQRRLGAPPPLCGPTATHLGGLALAAPLWMAATKSQRREPSAQNGKSHAYRPRAVVLGAGGCTVPAVLSLAGWAVTAVEPSVDVREAATRYFGAKEAGIDLVAGCGEEYLQGTTALADVLIVDAEDGFLAPPRSMRDESFWTGAVIPSLHQNAVVAVNLIGDERERMSLQETVKLAFRDARRPCEVWCCPVPAIANVSDRHSILFVTPTGSELDAQKIREATLGSNFVEREMEWMEEATAALPTPSSRAQ